MQSLLTWLDSRTGYKALMHEALYERIPGGARWRYVWGSTLVFVFVLQLITGFVLMTAYSANARGAWESVYYIQNEMTLGWLVRAIHHFAAQVMVVLMVFHLVQVIIDGAYKAPREVNFWLGLVLMQIVLGLGLTGYLLPWDQKGYYSTQVATNIMGSTPAIGQQIQQIAQGGSQYGHATLTRFFAMHVFALPASLVAFLALHIWAFRRHGITVPDPNRAPETTFWPDQVLRDAIACFAVLAAVMGLALWKGAELTAPANPAEAFSAARPEWYYLFLFRFLKFEWVSKVGEATHLGEAFGAVVLPGVLMTILFLAPIIGRKRVGHIFNLAFLTIVMLGAISLTGLTVYEDWFKKDKAGEEFRMAVLEAHRDGQRAVALAQSPTGIPPEGAIELIKKDPLTQGPKLFRAFCADCHQPASLSGAFAKPPEGPELADVVDGRKIRFASRDWTRSLLTNFDQHMTALKNITGPREAAAKGILEGSMQDWSKSNGATLQEAANKADFDALVEFVYAQSGRPDLSQDAAVLDKGRKVFETGMLAMGSVGACVDCHAMQVGGALLGEGTDAPNLTNYGGRQWLTDFISDPVKCYGDHNAMPGFADQLQKHELELLVRWMTGDYYEPPVSLGHE
jgi:ubiquinol-cytochrome c reductase cytochrome b subunit